MTDAVFGRQIAATVVLCCTGRSFVVAVARQSQCFFFSCRPLSEAEISEGRKRVLTVNSKNASVCLQKPNGPTKHFSFDAVYDES